MNSGTTHPVDSITRPCCGGIGRHTPDCSTPTGVPLPAGAHVWHVWAEDPDYPDRLCRTLSTCAQQVDETDVNVLAVITQLSDGTFVDKSLDRPLIYVDTIEDDGTRQEELSLTTAGARNLACALMSAADQLEGWTAAMTRVEMRADVALPAPAGRD